jgi:DNA-directed RNA polymerase specialized sigma24 family protein
MSALTSDAIFSHAALRGLIRRTVRPPRACPDALAFDADDIAQEFRLGLLRAAGDFDPLQGVPEPFARHVLGRLAGGIRRRRGRVERYGRPFSLDGFESGEPRETRTIAHEATRDMRIDMKEAIAALPNDLIPLVGLLLVSSIADVARAKGMPRSTLQRRIEKLRVHFEKAGLKIYL